MIVGCYGKAEMSVTAASFFELADTSHGSLAWGSST